jgi:shikimate 5-dehydrogenase/3-dehydroquinate dehydratase
MQLVVSILEETPERAIEAIDSLSADHDAVELRVDAFGGRAFDWAAVRAATAKPIIVTNRGGEPVDVDADFVDVEWGRNLPAGRRVILSHHDYEGMPDVERLVNEMRGADQVKVAVTPHNFADNARLLSLLDDAANLTVIGMVGGGLYSRILAPFFGSRLQFVSIDDARQAAPGQLSLAQALAIYGSHRQSLRAEKVFAIVGSRAAHSGSPAIHNAIFRERRIPAAYTIFETDDFSDIAEPFRRGDRFAPAGLSVTAPFKEEALRFAQTIGATIAVNARESGAVNTLVRIGRRIVADNTDVDGFETLLAGTSARTAAVVGAGGTARAALVALRRRGIAASTFNRSAGKLDARPLDELASWSGDLVINTLPQNVAIALPDAATIVEAAYGHESRATFTGLDLLRAQAVRQSELFLEACQ